MKVRLIFRLISILIAVIFLNRNMKDRIYDLVLFIVLIALEPDIFIYHETFDPLISRFFKISIVSPIVYSLGISSGLFVYKSDRKNGSL